jgi:hypothetical protein
MAKNHMKKCLTSLAINKVQIKTMLDSNSLLLEWLPSRTETTTNVGDDIGKKQLSYTTDGNVS